MFFVHILIILIRVPVYIYIRYIVYTFIVYMCKDHQDIITILQYVRYYRAKFLFVQLEQNRFVRVQRNVVVQRIYIYIYVYVCVCVCIESNRRGLLSIG
jgi:hypothetical protein